MAQPRDDDELVDTPESDDSRSYDDTVGREDDEDTDPDSAQSDVDREDSTSD